MALKKQKIILVVCLLLVLVVPVFVSARGLVPCGGYDPALPGGREHPCGVQDIFVLVARATNFLIAMAGVFAVYEIVSGGLWLALSMGNEEAITRRKDQIQSAIIGLVLVLMAYMFINTVVNYMLSRKYVTLDKDGKYTNCKFDLTNPLSYMTIDSSCSNLPPSGLQ